MTVETARWVDWRDPPDTGIGASRVYLGHETCQRLLPPPGRARDLARTFDRAGLAVSLVTPPLTDEGIARALAVVEAMRTVRADNEVVCGDWGLLAETVRRGWGVPVAGRLLAAQHVDPRIARSLDAQRWRGRSRPVVHLDGTVCRAVHRPPTRALRRHLRGTWLDRRPVLALLASLGVRRIELNHPIQGVETTLDEGWSCSLHLPDVLVSVIARCPGEGEDFGSAPACDPDTCGRRDEEWWMEDWEAPVYRRGNALFYRAPERPTCPNRCDRIVLGSRARADVTGS